MSTTPDTGTDTGTGTGTDIDSLTLSISGDEVTLSGTRKGHPVHKGLVKRPWVWSFRAYAYVLPRSLLPLTRTRRIEELKRAAEAAGVTLHIENTGEEFTEADRRRAREERLSTTAHRHQAAATKAAATADATEAASRSIRDGYPMGQPILIGHHSERRHRRDLDRAQSLDEKSVEADRIARRRRILAQGLRERLERGDDPVTLRLRIDRHEGEIRGINRHLEKWSSHALTSERDRLMLAVEIDRAALAHLEAEGKTVTYSRDNVAAGDQVQIRYEPILYTVKRANAKSVKIDLHPLTGLSGTRTVTYSKVTARRRTTDQATS